MKEGSATSTRTVLGAASARSLVRFPWRGPRRGSLLCRGSKGGRPRSDCKGGPRGSRTRAPPDDKTGSVDFSRRHRQRTARVAAIRTLHRTIQSVGATGGVYKGQGRSQRELMTRAY
ncbi:hypothetical protein Dsin_033006 [Dipteronia sinensis]|uniref:Uncharacterized protein n=1 Tax=Dipteronia sinensis TaxID=43782 RepID=A0AAE0DPC0_9ROSI|nr:hypothetical protein Dsin_033006 [Dipteronia sinensis]